MKLLVYGAGIQGSFLAAQLCNNPQNHVTILARGTRYQQLVTHGLRLHHILQHQTTQTPIHVIQTLAADDAYDFIFVTMKYNDFPTVVPVLQANCSHQILLIGNQLTPEPLQQALPQKALYFGFQNTGGTRQGAQINVLRFGKGHLDVIAGGQAPIPQATLHQIFQKTAYTWGQRLDLFDWLAQHAALITVLNNFDMLYQTDAHKARPYFKVAAQAFGELQVLLIDRHIQRPHWQERLIATPWVMNLGLRLLYHTPILKLAAGNFKEIAALNQRFTEFSVQQQRATPAFQRLAQQATRTFKPTA